MQQDQILLKLGEIAGKLGQVADTQSQMMDQLATLGNGQSEIMNQLGAVKSTQVEHDRRLTKAEGDISGLKTTSVRNATLIGALGGTGVAIIAEGIRQFLRLKS